MVMQNSLHEVTSHRAGLIYINNLFRRSDQRKPITLPIVQGLVAAAVHADLDKAERRTECPEMYVRQAHGYTLA